MIQKGMKVKVLYDFDGDPDNGELSVRAGEELTVTAQDIGDGWWEARNSLGHQGLIPEAYVQLAEPPEPSFPPPPPPPGPTAPPAAPHFTSESSDDVNGYPDNQYNGGQGYHGYDNHGQTLPQQSSQEGWDDDDWDDFDDQSSTSTAGHDNHDLQGQGNFGLSVAKREKISPTGGPGGGGENLSRYGTVRVSRFSNFAKAGGEAFLMGQATPPVHISEGDKVKIIETRDGPIWAATESYTCEIKSPKKESKLKGLKSFIAYQVIPSFSNIQVSRRYKHFDWLHKMLKEKFICIPVPPLPDKAIAGRYEDDFINERMKQLQYWMDRMVRHPVISHCDTFNHFLTCTDEKKWKVGKRKAEKDEFVGFKFFYTLDTPRQPLDVRDVESKMETFQKFVKGMDDNVKNLISVFHDNRKRHTGPFKKEFSRIGGAFKEAATTFNMDIGSYSRDLTAAIDYTGDTYNQIGEMYAKQPEKDIDPMHDMLYEYKGILGVFPDVLKVHEGALSKARECVKLQEDGKMQENEVTNVIQQSDIISYGTMAEVQNFQRQRVADFKHTMQVYLSGQIEFYKEITKKLEDALTHVDSS
ncbi:sorting nexin lst-4-like isoform X3 [Mytilus galloprovincialis]|uniref:sorting nexin lst-4-like isoform X3 n=1 Tax=Mytilus galloprovincialis TaxID=29158 RepID=UPI003F7C3B42